MTRRIDPQLEELIVAAHALGMTGKAIAKDAGVSEMTVGRVIKRNLHAGLLRLRNTTLVMKKLAEEKPDKYLQVYSGKANFRPEPDRVETTEKRELEIVFVDPRPDDEDVDDA